MLKGESSTVHTRLIGMVTLGLCVLVLTASSRVAPLFAMPLERASTAGQQASGPALVPLEAGVAIGTGLYHACAVTSSGGVKCWGYNRSGQLGNNSTTSSNVPVDVTGLAGSVLAIATGGNHTCALLGGGTVQCWGRNSNGQLGNNSTSSSPVPVTVGGLSNATAIAAGGNHTCAIVSGGGAKCWGSNLSGQLGDGSTVDRHVPVSVSGLAGPATAITAGSAHTCAVLSGGGIQCWGWNGNGQLGNNSTADSDVPVSVGGLAATATAVAAGNFHTCARTSSGGVKCWGNNGFGQLGNGSTTESHVPVNVSGVTNATAIATGNTHSCALVSGSVKCWGADFVGQLGNNSTAASNVPVNVSGLIGVAGISAGGDQACARTTLGVVKCWGSDYNGQLGNGDFGYEVLPVDVSGLSGASAIAAGSSHTCAVVTGGGVQCWGHGSSGELGTGSTAYSNLPVNVSSLTGASAITAGNGDTCVLLNNGTVKCWGVGWAGQLGNGSTAGSLVPVSVSGLTNVTAVAAGAFHVCALVSGGGVKCWGSNSSGQLGNNSTTNSSTPVDVIGLGGTATAIAAGYAHTCAVLSGGAVQCWGINGGGQLGDGSTTESHTPVNVIGLGATATALAAGNAHTCARTSTGGVKCWGSNSFGQLGDNSYTQRPTPVDVSGPLTNVGAISAGKYHTCALISQLGYSGVKCWGDNFEGQLGNGTTTGSNVPMTVVGLPSGILIGVNGIAAGEVHTCARWSQTLGPTGVKCWGSRLYGQLGNGKFGFSATPVNVIGLAGNLVYLPLIFK